MKVKDLHSADKFLVWPGNETIPRGSPPSPGGRFPGGARLRPNPQRKLADQCWEVLRFKHYSFRTEQTYLDWIERYVRFCRQPGGWRHSRECGAAELTAFLSHLAQERKVGAEEAGL